MSRLRFRKPEATTADHFKLNPEESPEEEVVDIPDEFTGPKFTLSLVEYTGPVTSGALTKTHAPTKIVENVTQQSSMVDVIFYLMQFCRSWQPAFDVCVPELIRIGNALDKYEATEKPYTPLKINTFKAFEVTELQKTRVVIIGQDPYHQLLPNGQLRAQGLSFSVSRTDEVPSSLQNIYKEIESEYPGWCRPNHGDLTGWAQQGVLLLNYCLTCPIGQADGHAKNAVWMPFIVKVLEAICTVRPNCIFVLWGMKAQKLTKYLGDRSHKLNAAHPSGLSAYRGFFGCGHFLEINRLLTSFGETPIVW